MKSNRREWEEKSGALPSARGNHGDWRGENLRIKGKMLFLPKNGYFSKQNGGIFSLFKKLSKKMKVF
jgi:hypothetical protein